MSKIDDDQMPPWDPTPTPDLPEIPVRTDVPPSIEQLRHANEHDTVSPTFTAQEMMVLADMLSMSVLATRAALATGAVPDDQIEAAENGIEIGAAILKKMQLAAWDSMNDVQRAKVRENDPSIGDDGLFEGQRDDD